MQKRSFIIVIVLSCSLFATEAMGNPLSKAAGEAIEWATKKFGGRALSVAGREAAETALVKAARRHGDEVFDIVRKGGLEAIDQGAKHGDEFWKLATRYPGAARSLALHADDLLPAARRIGPEVIEFEAHNPGLGLKTIGTFGDDGVKALVKASPEEMPRLLGYAGKAGDDATRRMFLDHYLKSANRRAFLNALNWKHIMATGLTAGAIVAAYQVSDAYQTASINQSEGIRDGLRTVAKEDPTTFMETVKELNRPWYTGLLNNIFWIVSLALAALLAFVLFPVFIWSWQKSRRIAREQAPQPKENPAAVSGLPQITRSVKQATVSDPDQAPV